MVSIWAPCAMRPISLLAAFMIGLGLASGVPAIAQDATSKPTPIDLEQKCRNLIIARSVQPDLIFYDQFLREVARISAAGTQRPLRLAIDDCDDNFLYIDISPAKGLPGIVYAPRYVHWRDLTGREVGARAAVWIRDVAVDSAVSKAAVAPAVKKPAPKKGTVKKR